MYYVVQVGDFGLVRWQVSGDLVEEICVMGIIGYLVLEYVEMGQIIDKVDVYVFGVVLFEFIIGCRVIDYFWLKN